MAEPRLTEDEVEDAIDEAFEEAAEAPRPRRRRSLWSHVRRAERYARGKAAYWSVDAWTVDVLTGVGTAMGLGLLSNSMGGSFDQKFGNLTIPVDGALGLGLGAAGIAMKNRALRTASVVAIGHAAVRMFEGAFHRAGIAIPGLKAGYDDLGALYPGPHSVPGYGPHPLSQAHGFGGFHGTPPYTYFGGGPGLQHDRLIEAARYL